MSKMDEYSSIQVQIPPFIYKCQAKDSKDSCMIAFVSHVEE